MTKRAAARAVAAVTAAAAAALSNAMLPSCVGKLVLLDLIPIDCVYHLPIDCVHHLRMELKGAL